MTVEAASVVSSVVANTDITFYLSIAAALISLATFTVGYSQMRIASAKTKLDLYNKRFNVYLVTLEFYQYVFSNSKEDIKERSNKLAQVCRESKFLFDEKDGIYETLGEFQKDAGVVRAMEESRRSPDSALNRSITNGLTEKHADALTNMGMNLMELEKKLKKYLGFHNVRGWTFF